MALLNSHTATRSFRELKYDLKVFLDGLDKISPVEGSSGEALIELKWADGSIDVVPSSEFITGMVSHLFPKVTIGNKANLIPDASAVAASEGKYYLNLNVTDAGVQAHIVEFGNGSENIVIDGGTIGTIKADTLNLATNVRIGKMQVGGNVHADNCTVNSGINVRSSLNLGTSSSFYNLRVTKTHVENVIRFITSTMPRATLDTYGGVGTSTAEKIFGLYIVKHLMSYDDYYDSSIQNSLNTQRAHIIAQIPIPRVPTMYSSGNTIGVMYDYILTKSTSFPQRMDEPFDVDTPASLLTLYPTKDSSFVTKYGTNYLKVVVPNGNNYLLHISNPTDTSIRACNAWMFMEDASADKDAVQNGVILPLSYVVLPPYSCTDFLFMHEIKGGNYCAYLMPTVELASN